MKKYFDDMEPNIFVPSFDFSQDELYDIIWSDRPMPDIPAL